MTDRKRGRDEPAVAEMSRKRITKPIQQFGMPVPRTLSAYETDKLIRDILQEIDAGLPGWRGDQTSIARHENPVSKDNKRKVRIQGNKHGCHTCLTKIAIDHTQPWIGDHIPPTALPEQFKDMLRDNYPRMSRGTVLYPQCDSCATEQSSLVRAIQAETAMQWTARISAMANTKAERLLTGGRRHVGNSTIATGPAVSKGQSQDIQALGRKKGCHSCGTDLPALKYHADHCPPVVMHMPTVDAICAELEIDLPAYAAKPQCPKCSHQQGGRMSSIKAALSRAADTLGMPNYWRS